MNAIVASATTSMRGCWPAQLNQRGNRAACNQQREKRAGACRARARDALLREPLLPNGSRRRTARGFHGFVDFLCAALGRVSAAPRTAGFGAISPLTPVFANDRHPPTCSK